MFDAAQISVRAEALLHATNWFLLSSNLHELARAVVDAADSMFAPSDSAVVFRTPTGTPAVFAAAARPDGSRGALIEALDPEILERCFAGDEQDTDDPAAGHSVVASSRHGARSGLALPIRTSSGRGRDRDAPLRTDTTRWTR